MDSNARSNGITAIVEHDYAANEPDELNLIKGTLVHGIKIRSGGWWEGTLATGKTGVFPDNFVRIIDSDDKNTVVLRDKSATINRKCKVVYSYTQNNNDELSLAVGEVIEFLGEVEEGWWRGKLGNRIGVFPSNFVITIDSVSPVLANRKNINKSSSGLSKLRNSLNNSREDLVLDKDAPNLPPKPIRELCQVLFPYAPANEDELELNEGDIITILAKELADKGWWKGELKGKVGVFPDNFVKLISSEGSPSREVPKPERPPTTPTSTTIAAATSTQPVQPSSGVVLSVSFGSRDSLNETGIVSGNVAAYRKSLENRATDNTSSIQSATTIASSVEKTIRKSFDSKIATSDFRKSLENLDEKKTTPPPVLTKKPVVPIKKSPTVSSVAGNLLSGLKQIVKSDKFSSNDSLDGVGGSKSSNNSHITDNLDKTAICERMKKDECEFDQVERSSSILQDMRAGRVKAPKRRLPTSSASFSGTEFNSNGNSNNNTMTYHQNGGSGISDSLFDTKLNATMTEDDTKAKIRNWEKHKAPWMDELKANQAKKTSPNPIEGKQNENKIFGMVEQQQLDFIGKSDGSKNIASSHKKSIDNSNSIDIAVDMKSSNTDGQQQFRRHETENIMSVSMSMVTSSTKQTSIAETITSPHQPHHHNYQQQPQQHQHPTGIGNAEMDNLIIRPSSVNFKNRSVSPVNRLSKSIHVSSSPDALLSNITTTASSSTSLIQKSTSPNTIDPSAGPTSSSPSTASTLSDRSIITIDNVCPRVVELERKLEKLEKIVHHQSQQMDDLMKLLKDESDKVKLLKTELDKYAQCVTQV